MTPPWECLLVISFFVTGDVRMNSNRDRQTSYAIMALKENAAKYSVAYTFSPRESSVVKPLENCTEEMKEVNDSRCFSKEHHHHHHHHHHQVLLQGVPQRHPGPGSWSRDSVAGKM